MSDNPAGLEEAPECDACGDQAACDAENWCIEHDSPLVPRVNPVGLPQEKSHGGAPENGRADAATQPNLSLIAALLDHAELLIADETGSVVCWHEYTAAEALRSECAQCCVELARREMGHVASRSDAPTTAVPAVPGGGQPAPSEPEVPPGDGRAAGAPLEGIGPSGSLDAGTGGGQPQQGEEAPAAKGAALRAWVHCAFCGRLWDDLDPDAESCSCPEGSREFELVESVTAPAVVAGADSGGPTTTPAATSWRLGCASGRHANDGRCLCEAEVLRLKAGGLDESDAVALLLSDQSGLLRARGGDHDHVGDDSAKDDLVLDHTDIVSVVPNHTPALVEAVREGIASNFGTGKHAFDALDVLVGALERAEQRATGFHTAARKAVNVLTNAGLDWEAASIQRSIAAVLAGSPDTASEASTKTVDAGGGS